VLYYPIDNGIPSYTYVSAAEGSTEDVDSSVSAYSVASFGQDNTNRFEFTIPLDAFGDSSLITSNNATIAALAVDPNGNMSEVSPFIDVEPPLSTTPWVTDGNAKTTQPYEMLEFNSQLYQTHIGLNRRIYTRKTSNILVHEDNNNKRDWQAWQTSADPFEETTLPISITAYNGRIYQTHVGAGVQGKIFTRSSSDGTNWTGWTKGNDAAEDTKKPVYMTSYAGKVYQVHVGLSGKIFTRSSNSVDGSGNITWSGWTKGNDAGEFTSLPVTMATFNDGLGEKLYQVHIGGNKKIYTRSSQNGIVWSNWTTGTDPNESTSTPVTMVANGGYLYQSHRGDSGQIFTRVSTNGSTWSGWYHNTGYTNLPVSLAVFNNKVYQGHVSPSGDIWWRVVN